MLLAIKRCCCLAALLIAAPAWAQAEPPLTPKQTGYAFEHPNVLLRQILYGRAHGVEVLAAACSKPTVDAPGTWMAYTAWRERQMHAIARMAHDLALWYFSRDASNASDADLVAALGLPAQIDAAVKPAQLNAACASFAHMLTSERYDLAALLAKGAPPANGAVPPAPTSGEGLR